MASIVREKVDQAIGILEELGVDLWLTLVRETSASPDPVLPLIFGDGDLTWQSALLVSRLGECIALVGRFDAPAVEAAGVYPTVVGYDESLRPELLRVLERLDPAQIALNYSPDDVLADGLSHGLYQVLMGYLADTPFTERLVSAAGVIGALRCRKTPGEVARIRAAVQITLDIYQRTFDHARVGMSEAEIATFMHSQLDELGLGPAWNANHCPAVNAGPDSPVGHVGAGAYRIERGQLLHFDFGVQQDGFCADLQRVVYFLAPGESAPPEPVQRGFEVALRALQVAVAAMKPGVRGVDVDAAGRAAVVEAGYPEYKHATGHHLGRLAHDGGGVLGPAWERYGDTPFRLLEAGHVYAVELGLAVPGYGYIGLEEDVLVTDSGAEYLGEPQVELVLR
jgi:Xaa-Pro aminopeptidase